MKVRLFVDTSRRVFMDDDKAKRVMSTLDKLAKSYVGERYSISLLPDCTISLDLYGSHFIEGATLKKLEDSINEFATLNYISCINNEARYPAFGILRSDIIATISLNFVMKI